MVGPGGHKSAFCTLRNVKYAHANVKYARGIDKYTQLFSFIHHILSNTRAHLTFLTALKFNICPRVFSLSNDYVCFIPVLPSYLF